MKSTLQARIDDSHLKKLAAIKARTGLNTSFLIRQMIDAVEVEPARINVHLSTNEKSDVNTGQGSHVAFQS
jgi:antitoxin component of RelBE/YafQ-DinJ toxin-antitoxin module